jgi:hypothetical protein
MAEVNTCRYEKLCYNKLEELNEILRNKKIDRRRWKIKERAGIIIKDKSTYYSSAFR